MQTMIIIGIGLFVVGIVIGWVSAHYRMMRIYRDCVRTSILAVPHTPLTRERVEEIEFERER